MNNPKYILKDSDGDLCFITDEAQLNSWLDDGSIRAGDVIYEIASIIEVNTELKLVRGSK